MLKILNNLKPFFENNYRRIHVREYAKLQNISPPTASKQLEEFKENNLIKKEIDKKYFYYFANKDSVDFRDLQRMYYRIKLNELVTYIKNKTIMPKIIIFGSVTKSEVREDSDIDIAIITPTKKKIETDLFEKKINRKIQLFFFKNFENIPLELKNNILNGYKIQGEI